MSPVQLQRLRRTLERRALAWLANHPTLSPSAVSSAAIEEIAAIIDLGEARAELTEVLERFVAQRLRQRDDAAWPT